MRLTLVLSRYPKCPPNGNIWIGKNKMVRKVLPKHMDEMHKNVEREKRNMAILLQPFLTKEQEAKCNEALVEEMGDAKKLWFKMRKEQIESMHMAPVPLSEHFKSLNKEYKW